MFFERNALYGRDMGGVAVLVIAVWRTPLAVAFVVIGLRDGCPAATAAPAVRWQVCAPKGVLYRQGDAFPLAVQVA